MAFLKDYWYMAGWDNEISEKPIQRIILGEPVVLFRDSTGEAVALLDQCAHRRMPLSLGRVNGNEITCPYHGFTYDHTGSCVKIPGQESVPEKIAVRRYPVSEKSHCVWVFMGDPQKSNDTPIFDCSLFDKEGWSVIPIMQRSGNVDANYVFLNDNLSDLLHLAELHGDARGASGAGNWAMGDADIQLEERPWGLRYTRISENITPPKIFQRLGQIQGQADRWHVVDFYMPCYFRVYTGAAEHGTGGPNTELKDGGGKFSLVAHHFITPETEKTSRYIQGIAHQFGDNKELVDAMRQLGLQVIGEDIWAIERQQASLDIYTNSPVNAIGIDDKVVKAVHSMLGLVGIDS